MGACNASPLHETDNSLNPLLATPSMGFLPQRLGARNVSSPRDSAMGRAAPLPSTGFLPPGSGARGAPPYPREDETIRRTYPHTASNAHFSEASITSGRSSPDVNVALRCGYGSPRRKSSMSALRSTSACKNGRNLPLSAINEESLDFANPDAPSDQREDKSFPPATGVPPAADGPVGAGFPP